MSNRLQAHLLASLAALPPGPLCVAFSGGPDSTALLHALAQLPEARARGLRALHVDHGLHPDSAAWAAHCERYCAALDVPCKVLRVQVDSGSGMGVEAAARAARYAALSTQLHDGECLLLGHHRDDQAETVLLKLLRGAGPEGLGGMRALRPFGRGQLWRPLLALSRQQLHDYVAARQLDCIDDPSNRDTRLARNRLRHEILPRLAQHWPHAVDSILHSAALSRAAADALRMQWLAAFAALHDPTSGSLDAHGWLALAPALREPLLDHWLHLRGLPAPTAAQRRQIERQCGARPGQLPCIRWAGAELHLWKGRLWALPPGYAIDTGWQAPWRGEPVALPDGGELSLTVEGIRLAEPLLVRLRRGGERIRPDGDAHTRELRDLFQQAQLPPWQRNACPLLYAGDELVAVADRWISARGSAIFRQAGAPPRWRAGR
ncbi:tRNA(Ile)-lysidine synthase [Rhodanobacter sp. FW510-R12]|uniref:tRNA lysidine(34) synthetase TilS n=1 Tax=unclassified Rhodanobacter TaxID=2621553 RepID=UPI0007AA1AB3|nr:MULTISPECIES: tRNA lysidine(34) synthetase TilS [unclassified Rhodanobacter]KZC16543.1 tRNA(Ile)-lysidine synthase [Rhodanobacter sp. FW104-R8]KZC25916.1 tRNA(Ile)-lysidine synthase [Rhodanobacter sp. FW510-T8]KZC31557.1 tRNA(Ile)-lysidine synthase [Rhodanobacter sp. FW510-R10]